MYDVSASTQAPARPHSHRPPPHGSTSRQQRRAARGHPQLAASRLARTRARARMMRRRRRTALITLLLVITSAWFWQVTHRPAALAEQPAVARLPALSSPAPQVASPVPSATPSAAATPSPSVQPLAKGSYVLAGTGQLSVVPGTGRIYGTGPLRRYLVEVEGGLGEDGAAFAAFVEKTLGDPRSWTHGGAISLQRVDSGPVSFRVTLASPRTVDRYCAPLNTAGYTSCYNSRGRAMLNQARWETGVPWYVDDMTTYREYMINHESGHALGHDHVYCPRPGALAPTMQQQTLGMQGCKHNAWPYP